MRYFLKSKMGSSEELAEKIRVGFPSVKILMIAKSIRGVVTVEDVAGVGKETLAKTLDCEIYDDMQFDMEAGN